MINNQDLILEAVKNSVEAGARNIDLYIEKDTFSVIDDGVMEYMPALGKIDSSKGEGRGRGLFLLFCETDGRVDLKRERGKTILKATFCSDIDPSEIIPSCFNLTDLTFHRFRDGKEAYYINKDILDSLNLDAKNARDLAKLKKFIREKELRS